MVSENNHFINPVGPIGPETPRIGELKPAIEKGGETTSFKDLFKQYINDVNNMQRNANESITKLATGEIKDVHQVMTAAAEAEISFKMMMEIRNKLVSAYQELMRTNI